MDLIGSPRPSRTSNSKQQPRTSTREVRFAVLSDSCQGRPGARRPAASVPVSMDAFHFASRAHVVGPLSRCWSLQRLSVCGYKAVRPTHLLPCVSALTVSLATILDRRWLLSAVAHIHGHLGGLLAHTSRGCGVLLPRGRRQRAASDAGGCTWCRLRLGPAVMDLCRRAAEGMVRIV